MSDDLLRSLVDLRDKTIQKSRIAFSNRTSAIERGSDEASEDVARVVADWENRFEVLEGDLDDDIRKLAATYPIIKDMECVKGIGLMLAAKLVALIDIEKADTVSALWRYCGYATIDGVAERRVKGEKLHYNARLKTTCYIVASSMLRSNSPYRSIYDSSRVYYEANRPDWTKAHQHLASMRRMVKVFLAHLWEHWRLMEGLPVREPYVISKLGHTGIISRFDFGWPSPEVVKKTNGRKKRVKAESP